MYSNIKQQRSTMQNHNYFCTPVSVDLGVAHSSPLLQWGLGQDGDLEGHLLTICPAGNTCSPVSLWEEEGTAEGGDSTCHRGGVSTWLPGSPHITRGTGRMKGTPPLAPAQYQGILRCLPTLPTPHHALTVAVREVSEAFSTRVTSRPCEVWPAVAAASQVLTRPVCEVRLTVAA